MAKYTVNYVKEALVGIETLYDLRKNHSLLYQAVRRNGWEELVSHLPSQSYRRTKEECETAFLKYQTRQQMRDSTDNVIYDYAKNHGWVAELSTHMKRLKIRFYTYQTCKEVFQKYTSSVELLQKDSGAYNWALKKGHIDELSSHFVGKKKTKDGTYTKEYLIQLFQQYSKIVEVSENHNGAYQTAVKKGWIDECTAHMSGFGNRSSKEEALMEEIKKTYPSAISKWFGKGGKGIYAKRFQLDIFIPELNKAIEFNGDYWHSTEALRLARPAWPIEMVENYHEIKRAFFADLGITYLEITETAWKINSKTCIEQSLSFLKE